MKHKTLNVITTAIKTIVIPLLYFNRGSPGTNESDKHRIKHQVRESKQQLPSFFVYHLPDTRKMVANVFPTQENVQRLP